MRRARLLLLPLAAVLIGLGCSSTKGSSPLQPPPAPYVATVASLVTTPDADRADTVDVDTLNLQGLDTADDDTAFNAILGN